MHTIMKVYMKVAQGMDIVTYGANAKEKGAVMK